jgi:hypothetical protein
MRHKLLLEIDAALRNLSGAKDIKFADGEYRLVKHNV